MSPEQEKLMIAMGKAIEGLQKDIIELKKKDVPPTTPAPAAIPLYVSKPGLTSQIEHTEGNKFFKMDVRMEGLETLPFEERQKISEQFLRELEGLFEDYKVIKLEGKYHAKSF